MHKIKQSKLKIESVLRRFHISLGLYSLPNWYKLSLRRSSTFNHDSYSGTSISSLHAHIFSNRFIRTSAVMAIFMLVLLTSAILIPIYNNIDITEAATGTAKESSLSFNLTNSTASVDLSVNDANGTFASSSDDNSKVRFNISTTNYTGYTLSIKGINNNQTLVNGTNSSYTLSSISTATESFNSTDYNNKWGYLPSKLNSSTNTSYLPAPTTSATTLDKTSSANTSGTVNNYTIGIGARASYTTPAGEYTGTYILTAVANNVAYYIAFNDNTNDSTVTNLPTAISSSVSTTSITLPSTTPTRTGYTFKSWCLGTVSNNGTTCAGTQFNKSSSFGLDQTTANGTNTAPVNLYAVWTINTYNLVITGDSYLSSMTLKQGSTSGTTINGTKSGNTVTFSNLTYGISYYLYPVFTSGYEFSGYTKTDSATGAVLGSTSAVNTYYTMGAGNGAVKVTGKASVYCTASNANCMQYYTKSTCSSNATTGAVLMDARDGKTYNVRYINGNCWMTQNLRFTGTNVNSTTTNINTTKTLNYNDLSLSANNSSSGPCYGTNSGGNGYTNLCIKDSGNASYGVYYNYAAATAGTFTGTSNSTAASYDICPKNWHLPTGPNTTSGTDFNKLVGNTTAGWQSSTTGFTAFGAVAAGHYANGSLSNDGTSGVWWSATMVSTSNVSPYGLAYSSKDGYFQGGDGYYRYYGFSIRCVRTS